MSVMKMISNNQSSVFTISAQQYQMPILPTSFFFAAPQGIKNIICDGWTTHILSKRPPHKKTTSWNQSLVHGGGGGGLLGSQLFWWFVRDCRLVGKWGEFTVQFWNTSTKLTKMSVLWRSTFTPMSVLWTPVDGIMPYGRIYRKFSCNRFYWN